MIAAAADSFASNSFPTSHSTRPVPKMLSVRPTAKITGANISKNPRPCASCSDVMFGFWRSIFALCLANSASMIGCVAFFVRKNRTVPTTTRKSRAIPNFPSLLRAKTEDGV